jgi:CheY-like chemotaxis protein
MLQKTVVLIDDDEDDYEIFSMALEEMQETISCIYFSSAKKALEYLIENKSSRTDFILLDLNMPVMDGINFLENIQAYPSILQIPIVVYSTSMLPYNKEKVMALGASYFFIKPFSQKEFIEILEGLFHPQYKM